MTAFQQNVILNVYSDYHHRPERMVVAGVGVEHDTLVEAVQRHFVDSEPVWGRDTKVVTDRSVAQYTG